MAGGPKTSTPEDTNTASSGILDIGSIEGSYVARFSPMDKGVIGDLSSGVPTGDEVCSGTTSAAGSESYRVRSVELVRCELAVGRVVCSFLYLVGTAGGSGMSLGKKEVICGKLEPDGDRNDCDFVDGALAALWKDSGFALGDRTSSELLYSDGLCWPALPRLSKELMVEFECLVRNCGRSPGRASACREPSALLERVLGANDCLFDASRAFSFSSFSRSFRASGTPSHLALTFGTC